MKVAKEYTVKKLLDCSRYILEALHHVDELRAGDINFSIVNDEECKGFDSLDLLNDKLEEEYNKNPQKKWTKILENKNADKVQI